MAMAEKLALRIGGHGGAALIIDYGQAGPYADSLVAIRDHQGVKVRIDGFLPVLLLKTRPFQRNVVIEFGLDLTVYFRPKTGDLSREIQISAGFNWLGLA